MILGNDQAGRDVHIQLERLIESRLLVQANSGAGKSFTLRRILEQSYGKVQQLVIDVEDEFYTLRESFDYVLAGRYGGDCPADVRSAQLLARRLLELGTSSIIGIYELKSHDRVRFVRLFLESLISAPRALWHPVLVVIDECHLFAPEKGHGEAESAQAVIDLMTLGRKRGFCGIPATQRISKLHKDVCEVNNKLIGRSALDVDMKRAARELGFSSREQELELRMLKPGEFFAFGPAISEVVIKVKVGPVTTTHPKSGQQVAPPPPPREKVRSVLAQLADLPKEAEQQAATLEDLKKQVVNLRRELLQAQKQTPAAAKPERIEIPVLKDDQIHRLEIAVERVANTIPALAEAAREIQGGLKAAANRQSSPTAPQPAVTNAVHLSKPAERPPRGAAPSSNGHVRLGPGELSILTACAQYYETGCSREQLSILTAYKRSSRDAYIQRLAEKGLVRRSSAGSVICTEGGIELLGPGFEPLPTGAKLQAYWLGRLPEGERRIFEVLLRDPGRVVPREEVDVVTGYKRSSRDAYIQRLRARMLVEVSRDGVRLAPELLGDAQ